MSPKPPPSGGGEFTDNNAVANGMCFALCAQWLKLHRQNRGKSPQWRIDNLRRLTTIHHAAALHEVYKHKRIHGRGKDSGFGAFGAMRLAMNNEGMTLSKLTSGRFGDEEDFVTLVNSTHRYCAIDLQFKPAGGHSLACYKSSGKRGWFAHLYVFDPNLGEMKVGSGTKATQKFLDRLMAHYGERGIRLQGVRVFEVSDGDPWDEPEEGW